MRLPPFPSFPPPSSRRRPLASPRRADTRGARILGVALLALSAQACVGEFDLGVGAFEIGQRDAILWTHVQPLDPDRGRIVLRLEVATDPGFDNIVRERAAFARRENDFTVQSKVRGLNPGTVYYYRFRGLDETLPGKLESRVGRFRTAPTENDAAPVRFVISGDSNQGYVGPRGLDFYVMSAAAEEAADFFVYFGDTVYADSGILPGGADAFTLDEYRTVHKLTRADPHLQAVLASTGTFSGWDDHEVRNDYAGETVDPAQFEAGARAFFEYLPLRARPEGDAYRTHRRVRWGRHVELFFLDGRQFRSAEQFCNETLPDGPETAETLFSPFTKDEEIAADIVPPTLLPALSAFLEPSDPDCVDTLLAAPGRTLLGSDQLAWLQQALLDSTATFKIIVNDVPISDILFSPYDRWEGYVEERAALLAFIGANLDPTRTLVLTTDFHTNAAVRRSELTELVVGPIGQSTFGTTVSGLLPANLQPFLGAIFGIVNQLIDRANGDGSLLGVEHDAFSYAVIEVFEEEGEAKLVATVRGDPAYMDGANDPALVQDLFSFEMP